MVINGNMLKVMALALAWHNMNFKAGSGRYNFL